jgi:hypothetical protein
VTGSAKLVSDNPGKIAAQVGEATALELAPGSSATSPPICVSSGQGTKKLGTAPDEYGWDATRKMSVAQGQLTTGRCFRRPLLGAGQRQEAGSTPGGRDG